MANLNLYEQYNNPSELFKYDEAVESIPMYIWKKYGEPISGKRGFELKKSNIGQFNSYKSELTKHKLKFTHNVIDAMTYANTIRAEFPEGEDIISTKGSPYQCFSYALLLNRRFYKGEETLMKDDYYGSEYFEHLDEHDMLDDATFAELQAISKRVNQ